MRKIEIGLEVHRAIEAARRAFEQSEDEILCELLGRAAQADNTTAPPTTERHAAKVESAIAIGKRTTGNWSVVDGETSYIARNLREAYITALDRLAQRNPTLLPALAAIGGKRRRIVAESAQALFPGSPHLAKPERNNWHKLGEWYVDLNLSREQVAKRVKQACLLSNVRYGGELAIKEGLSAL